MCLCIKRFHIIICKNWLYLCQRSRFFFLVMSSSFNWVLRDFHEGRSKYYDILLFSLCFTRLLLILLLNNLQIIKIEIQVIVWCIQLKIVFFFGEFLFEITSWLLSLHCLPNSAYYRRNNSKKLLQIFVNFEGFHHNNLYGNKKGLVAIS